MIHAPLAGCDVVCSPCSATSSTFQSTHPRGVRPKPKAMTECLSNFNPRTREGCDACSPCKGGASNEHFNPRTREGCDKNSDSMVLLTIEFQSTHPRGVRLLSICFSFHHFEFQSTHPRGVRRTLPPQRPTRGNFNPRTREGCDRHDLDADFIRRNFNPRTREGCDPSRASSSSRFWNFKPRTPCGVRLKRLCVSLYELKISIHAPHAGCDGQASSAAATRRYFNPRTPCGVRP